MTKQQRQIVREFIELHNSKVSTHLRSLGLLNNNGTLPSGEGAQINLERWFFDVINSDNYTLRVTDAGNVEAYLEIGSFYSHSGNPVIFEFDAAAWPSLFEEAVLVSVEKGVVNRPDVFIEPHIMVDICGDSLAASYQDLFINDDLGAIADLPGMTNALLVVIGKQTQQEFIWKLIDAEQEHLLKAVLQYGADLVKFDEDGNATPESSAEVTQWLDKNDLTESLGRIIESGVVG
jgi:hypothetical protein